MDFKYISPYKRLVLYGIKGIIISSIFILEGAEYNKKFFDRINKFLVGLITNYFQYFIIF